MEESFVLPADVADVDACAYLWNLASVEVTERLCCGYLVIESDWADRQALMARLPGTII